MERTRRVEQITAIASKTGIIQTRFEIDLQIGKKLTGQLLELSKRIQNFTEQISYIPLIF
jgi:hypothetical protein